MIYVSMAKTLQRIFVWVFVIGVTCVPVLAEDETPLDGRFSGYPSSVASQPASTALIWILLVGLGILCVGPLFLNAHRTHLD